MHFYVSFYVTRFIISCDAYISYSYTYACDEQMGTKREDIPSRSKTGPEKKHKKETANQTPFSSLNTLRPDPCRPGNTTT